jgi:two-component system sensor histidine kinase HydH
MNWSSFLIGALAGATAAALVTLWLAGRALLRAKRLRRRARSIEHLLQLAQLTGGLAHEIKNPLSAIKLNLKLLAEDMEHRQDERDRRNFIRLRRLQDEVQRLHDTLGEFLRYAGNMELHRRDCDLRQVVEELVDFFRPQAESGRVVLRVALPDKPIVCQVDEGLLKQAILNLMINATQAMSQGGELLLRLNGQRDRASLEVIDTGPGIEPEARERIFQAYYSTRPGGSGLGLPLTRRIIRLHEGEISVDGEPGKGTRFTVALPLAGKK